MESVHNRSVYTLPEGEWKIQRPPGISSIYLVGADFVVRMKGFVRLLPTVASHVIPWVYAGCALSNVAYVQYRDQVRGS